jgi:hypothetical protein
VTDPRQVVPLRQTPEERELAKKRAELSTVESALADRELDLITLRNELKTFETHYFRLVGQLFAELDDTRARLAETLAYRNPGNPDLGRQAAEARTQANQSASAIGESVPQEDADTAFSRSDELKKLYREIAKLVHPDLVTEDGERTRRTRLMAEANQAYGAGDEAKLRAILDDWVSNPESVHGEGVAAELVRTIRKIHQVKRRLEDIQSEMMELKQSELYTLSQRVETLKTQGRDLLAEIVEQLEHEIAAARSQLATLGATV